MVKQLYNSVVKGGTVLVVEPAFHVKQQLVMEEVELFEAAGFSVEEISIGWLQSKFLVKK